MAKEWLGWVRDSVGYEGSGLTRAHYDKLCRGPTKRVTQFLQEHIRNEEETRMIKENLSLYCEDSKERDLPRNIDSMEKERSRIMLEIQAVEDRINTLSKTGPYSIGKQQETLDLQRRGTLLRGVLQQERAVLDTYKGHVEKLETFLEPYLKRMPESRDKQEGDSCCRGSRHSGLVLDQFWVAVEELGTSRRLKDLLADFDFESLVSKHNPRCIVNIITRLMNTPMSCGEKFTDTDGASDTSSVTEILQRDHVQLVKEVAVLYDERNTVESAVGSMNQELTEASGKDGPNQTNIEEHIKEQLIIAGLRGALNWIERILGKENLYTEETLTRESVELEKDRRQLDKVHSELKSLDEQLKQSVSMVLDEAGRVSSETLSAQEILRSLIENYSALGPLIARFTARIVSTETTRASLNGINTMDVFQQLRTVSEDGRALADLLAPQLVDQTHLDDDATRRSQYDKLDVHVNALWEFVEDRDLDPGRSLNDLQDRESAFRDNDMAQVLSKIASSDETLSALDSVCLGLWNNLTNW